VLKATIYRQNVVWPSKLVLQLLFFVKFWFFCFFLYFFKMSNINVDSMRKISTSIMRMCMK
jgi:hypothetical protein